MAVENKKEMDSIIEKGALGNAIRKSRLQNNLSQESFSEMVGITPTHLKHLESEHRKPSIEVLFRIAKTLNMSIDNIIFSNTGTACKKRNELDNILSTCTASELQIILDLAYSIKKNIQCD